MKALLVSTPAMGHLNPLLGIGRILISDGHEVMGLSSNYLRGRIEDIGAKFRSFVAAADFDPRMLMQRPGDRGGKPVTVDRQRTARRHLVGIRRPHDQRAEPAHLGMQQPDRVIGRIVGTERVGADKFGKPIGAMGFRHPLRAHLVQDDAGTGVRDLPSGLGARKAAANDMHDVGSRSGPVHGAQGLARFQRRRTCVGNDARKNTTTPAAGRALSVSLRG